MIVLWCTAANSYDKFSSSNWIFVLVIPIQHYVSLMCATLCYRASLTTSVSCNIRWMELSYYCIRLSTTLVVSTGWRSSMLLETLQGHGTLSKVIQQHVYRLSLLKLCPLVSNDIVSSAIKYIGSKTSFLKIPDSGNCHLEKWLMALTPKGTT
jgi:hypothetical protein